MKWLEFCATSFHELDSHKAEALQFEIRAERQKSWQNGNDVLSAAGTHWYWNEGLQVGLTKQWQSCIVEQWEALWHVIQCLGPPIQISKAWLSCIQLSLITLRFQPLCPCVVGTRLRNASWVLFPNLFVLWGIWDQLLWTCEGHVWFINISIS